MIRGFIVIEGSQNADPDRADGTTYALAFVRSPLIVGHECVSRFAKPCKSFPTVYESVSH